MLILLADDERMIRLGLQSMLEELYPGCHTYLHARNGQEVLDLLAKYEPDVAFLDIKMPLLNGLEALSECRNSSDSTIWIILTGYADFDYARQALSLSVFDYLLKPVDLKTLKNLFERIHTKNKLDKIKNNAVFSHEVSRSFNMAEQFSAGEVEFRPTAESDYILYQFYIDSNVPNTQKKIKQKLSDSLHYFCQNTASVVNYCLFFNTEGNLCLVCDIPDASRLTHFISLQNEGLSTNAFSVFFGNNHSMKNIYLISQRISHISEIRLLTDCSRPVYLKNIEALPSLSLLLSFAHKIFSLLSCALSQNQRLCLHLMQELKTTQSFSKAFSLSNTQILSNYLSSFFTAPLMFDSYSQFLHLLEKHSLTLASAGLGDGGTDLFKIQEYIRNNYADDVGIARVSELFSLSPSYLSRLFHEKTGQKYIDFVTQIRMEAAQKMREKLPDASVRQIAEAVGYTSVRHFSKVFQKYTGVLPSNFPIPKEDKD